MDLSMNVSKKMRLEDFLRQNLDAAPSPRIIEWVDRASGVFRILWTHQSSGSFHHDDAALFRYWALARGKSAHQSSVELKQSLRMALNKSPCVERLPAEPLTPDYRYFRFVESSHSRSKSRRQRSMRSAGPEAWRHALSVDSDNNSLWTHHVDQDQPINLSLEATKTNSIKQVNTSSNCLEKQGGNETMDSNACCNLNSECFSVTCKENIHHSTCITHAMTNVNEMATRRKECRSCGRLMSSTSNDCTDSDCPRPERLAAAVTKKPLFRPYALGDTTLNSDFNIHLNEQEICYKNDSTIIYPMHSHEQFTFLMPPKFSADFDYRDTANYFGCSRNIEEEDKFLMIGENFQSYGIITESNRNFEAGYFQ